MFNTCNHYIIVHFLPSISLGTKPILLHKTYNLTCFMFSSLTYVKFSLNYVGPIVATSYHTPFFNLASSKWLSFRGSMYKCVLH